MKLRTFFQITLMAGIVLASLLACSGAGTDLGSSSTSESDFTADTQVDVIELEVKTGMISNVLAVKMDLQAGRLTFRLFSPDGEVQWEETFEAPATCDNTLDLDVVPGTWRLELELENATGEYDIRWNASNDL